LKTKYQDSLLDNKRLQDRIDSLEFYTKNHSNSSAFHNLIPSSYTSPSSTLSNSSTTTSITGTRGRTPAPIAPRPRLGSTSSYINSDLSSFSTMNNNLSSRFDSNSSASSSYNYRPSVSRQTSVERSFIPSLDSTSTYTSVYNSPLGTSGTSMRSRNSSPDRWALSSNPPTSPTVRNLSSLPPHPSFSSHDSYSSSSSSRYKREPSTERSLRNMRRETSQERYTLPPSVLKTRRSSFVDNVPSRFY